MKKLVYLGLTILAAFTLVGCNELTNNEELLVSDMGSEESLATLSYLSAGFLDFSNETVVLSNTTVLSNTVEEETVIEGELDEVNVYIDRLKGLIDNGVDGFGSVNEEPSDNELYTYKLTFTVNDEVYIIYYNIDEVTGEMTGIILIGDVEYDFEVMDNMKEYEYNYEEKNEYKEDNNDNDNQNNNGNKSDDDDEVEIEEELDQEEPEEDEEDDDESETKMVLVATNGIDTIKIIYKTEIEEDESTVKFYVEQTIAGVEKRVTLKISEEEDETKVTISDGEDSYTFKREVEDEGVVYKLQYEVDGVKGMVIITEITDEEGNITYDYFIQEAGREKHTEKQEPKSDGFDHDDDEEDEEDESEA